MKKAILFFGLIISLFFTACNESISSYTDADSFADIYPQYEGTYIPYNIAPLNFRIEDSSANKFIVRFAVARRDSFDISTSKNVRIPIRKWKNLLENNKGSILQIKIFANKNNEWHKYQDLYFQIANEPIDPYIAYRLIESGYTSWNKMGIYQRCIENFDESPIMLNTLTEDRACINCHSFRDNDPGTMLFHLRKNSSGTIIVEDGTARKVDLKASWMDNGAVYPRWNPQGRYIAFSSNNTAQGFRTSHANKIEVYDIESDIVIYDTEKNTMFTSPLLYSKQSFETFPEWSPDGRYLYFCSARQTTMPEKFDSIRYDLIRVAFDPQSGKLSNRADTIFAANALNKSASMPRISPDGKHLLFCLSDYGTFPIWHKENDIYHLNLETSALDNMPEMNSDQSDSYHSWSSNGRWVVFSSRRIDGRYTRPFISYFDADGTAHKPILLPQQEDDYYDLLTKSYNIPEFITGKVEISPRELKDAALSNPRTLSE